MKETLLFRDAKRDEEARRFLFISPRIHVIGINDPRSLSAQRALINNVCINVVIALFTVHTIQRLLNARARGNYQNNVHIRNISRTQTASNSVQVVFRTR